MRLVEDWALMDLENLKRFEHYRQSWKSYLAAIKIWF
jgi:hypothetical protein